MKVKLVFDKCARLCGPDDRPAFLPNGDPAYEISFQWVIAIDAPEKSKAPA